MKPIWDKVFLFSTKQANSSIAAVYIYTNLSPQYNVGVWKLVCSTVRHCAFVFICYLHNVQTDAKIERVERTEKKKKNTLVIVIRMEWKHMNDLQRENLADYYSILATKKTANAEPSWKKWLEMAEEKQADNDTLSFVVVVVATFFSRIFHLYVCVCFCLYDINTMILLDWKQSKSFACDIAHE